MLKKTRSIRIILIIAILGIGIIKTYSKNETKTTEIIHETHEISLSDFMAEYNQNSFKKIEITNDKNLAGYILLTGNAEKNKIQYDLFKTKKSENLSITDLGIKLDGDTEIIIKTKEEGIISGLIKEVVPFLIILVLGLLFFRFALPKGGGLPFNTKAGTDNSKSKITTKFKDVAGMEEVKEELSEIVDYLKNPGKYHKVGARHPKGVLLYGQPGSGKTLLARAVAGEASVPFFSASGSEFMEMLVGMGAAKVRNLFQKAKSAGTAIIFIDEIDAIGGKRGVGHTGGHQEQEQTLNQILTEMDGFDNKAHIIVIAATNRPDMLDPALLRAGRFDRKILVSAPTYEERKQIFDYYLKDKKVDGGLNLDSLIKRTSGLVGADIENIVNEAALKLAKTGKEILTENEFEYAIEKVLMGPEKKIKSMQEKEKKTIAYHELGHAVTSYVQTETDKVEKITIVRRGHALGATRKTPEEDKYLYSKKKILQETISLLGGRASEDVFLGKDNITTGASNDFERATRMITDMVMKYGMDDELGPIMYFDEEKSSYSLYKPYSEKTAEKIDQKINHYITDCYKKSVKIILKHKELIEYISKILLDKEYLTRDEFNNLMQGNDIITKKNDNNQHIKTNNQREKLDNKKWRTKK